MASIYIKATSAGGQQIISVLEGNLNFEEVSITHQNYEVKSITLLDFLITAVSNYALREFLLSPMVGPMAEKWKAVIKHVLHPVQPFNLVIDITEENFKIEAPLGTSHNFTAEIWRLIQDSLDILKKENLQQRITRIRFVPNGKKDLLVFCYAQNNPELLLDLEKGESYSIPPEKIQFAELEGNMDADVWFENEVAKAKAYGEHLQSD